MYQPISHFPTSEADRFLREYTPTGKKLIHQNTERFRYPPKLINLYKLTHADFPT